MPDFNFDSESIYTPPDGDKVFFYFCDYTLLSRFRFNVLSQDINFGYCIWTMLSIDSQQYKWLLITESVEQLLNTSLARNFEQHVCCPLLDPIYVRYYKWCDTQDAGLLFQRYSLTSITSSSFDYYLMADICEGINFAQALYTGLLGDELLITQVCGLDLIEFTTQFVHYPWNELLDEESSVDPPSTPPETDDEDDMSDVDGYTYTFQCPSGKFPIIPSSITITYIISGETYHAYDHSPITGEFIGESTVVYVSGSVSVTFTEHPDATPIISWSYEVTLPSFVQVASRAFVYLDGILINNYITECKITQRDSDVLTSVDITFKDTRWFDQVDPQINKGQERITVTVDDDTWSFLLETREGSEDSHTLSIWGRNPAAVLTEPHSETITDIYFNTMASTIITELANGVPVYFSDIEDFPVEEFTLDGYALDGIQTLAQVLGGILRSGKNQSLYIRKRLPVRPVDMPFELPDLTLDRYSNILSSSYSEDQPQFNSVRIVGSGSTESEITIETEDEASCYTPGEIVNLKVYKKPGVEYILCATSGTLTPGLTDVAELIEDEIIDITDESGSFSQYFTSIVEYNFEGTPKKPKYDDWPEGGVGQTCEAVPLEVLFYRNKEVHVPNAVFGKLKASYYTIYDQWTFTSSVEVESIVAALGPEFGKICVQITDENFIERYVAPEISDELLINEGMAMMRGLIEFDDVFYRKHKWTLKVPYVGLVDGEIVRLEDDFWGLIGNAHVKTADISIIWDNAVRVYQDLEVHQYSKI